MKVIDIDGARVSFPDGWGLVRASNTQPALVLRFEAETLDRLGEIRDLVESTIETIKENVGKMSKGQRGSKPEGGLKGGH